MTRKYAVDGIDTRLAEHRIADAAREWDNMNALDMAECAPDEYAEDAQVAALYEVAFTLWHAGEIDDVCLDDLLDIAFR